MAACLPAQGRVQVEAAACLRSLLGRVQVAAAACLQSLRVHRQSCQAEAVAAGHSPNLLLLQAAVAFLAARQAVVVVVVAFLRRRTLACTRIERKSVHEATRGDVRFKFHCRAAPTLSLTGAVNGAPLCARDSNEMRRPSGRASIECHVYVPRRGRTRGMVASSATPQLISSNRTCAQVHVFAPRFGRTRSLRTRRVGSVAGTGKLTRRSSSSASLMTTPFHVVLLEWFVAVANLSIFQCGRRLRTGKVVVLSPTRAHSTGNGRHWATAR